jgi:uncharacterized membrane-anchored protein
MKFHRQLLLFKIIFSIILTASLPFATSVYAQHKPQQHNSIIDAANRQQDAFDAALNVSIPGPAKINLGAQGTLNLPENYFFIPPKEAANLLHNVGDKTGPDFMGLVIPKDHIHWFITIDYIKSGFIKDFGAKYWHNDDLLAEIKKSNAEENQQNGTALDVIGWIEPPRYDVYNHRLLWSVLAKSQNDTSDNNHQSINYNAYLLGRDGYFNLNLITSNAAVNDDKKHAQTILLALNYLPGKRYEDFNKKTDAIADYDLTTLVTERVGKTDFIELGSYIFYKIWKILLLSFALWLVIARRLYKFKIKQAQTALENKI